MEECGGQIFNCTDNSNFMDRQLPTVTMEEAVAGIEANIQNAKETRAVMGELSVAILSGGVTQLGVRSSFSAARGFIVRNTEKFAARAGAKVEQRLGAGGEKGASKLFDKLTGGKSRELSDGGRVGSLRDGSGVQISSRVKDGVKQTSIRITGEARTGSRIPERIKIRFEEKIED